MLNTLLKGLKTLAGWVAESWRMLKLTLFSALFVLVGGVFLAWVPQGLDLLHTLADDTRNAYFRQHQIVFIVASVSWALSAWYCARVLVTRRMPDSAPDTYFQVYLRIWLPRIYGALSLFVVAYGFWKVNQSNWAIAYGLLTALFMLYFLKRRDWFGNFPGTVKQQVDSLPPITRKLIHWALALSFVLFGLFVALPVKPAQMIGAQAIVLFALTSWIIFGSFILVLLPKIYGWPSLALLPVFLFVAFSPLNDNHAPRRLADFRAVDCAADANNSRCQNLAQHFKSWLAVRQAAQPSNEPYPVYIIAAEGGGIRAAYWTAAALTHLHDRNPAFSQHVYAISGVSGGSLGAAVYTALLAEKTTPECANRSDGAKGLAACARAMLSQDFLSPVLAYSLYPDQIQRLLPFPIAAFDRARGLEYAWESAWAREVGNQKFGAAFSSLWQDRPDLPALFLNSTVVETGQRAIISNLRIDPNEFPDALDGFGATLQLPEPPLSTAVNISARFTVVSPAARVNNESGKLHLVDGGYHENTGALTAADILRTMEQLIQRDGLNARPVVIVIRNQPTAKPEANGSEFLGEFWHPLKALLQTRTARSAYYLDTLAAALNLPGKPQQFFVVQPPPDSASAPLGWSMSRSSTDVLDVSLKDSKTSSKFDEILGVLHRVPPPKPSLQEMRP
jgi:predicted acylesterase/phospholipase RssA